MKHFSILDLGRNTKAVMDRFYTVMRSAAWTYRGKKLVAFVEYFFK